MLLRRLVPAIAGVALVAGCGGSSGDSDPSSAPTSAATVTAAPPRDLTIDDLSAALPDVDAVPGATEIALTCPDDGPDRCATSDGDVDGTDIVLLVGGGSATDREVSDAASNFVSVRADLHPTEDAAAAQLARVQDSAQDRDGSFDIPAEETQGVALPDETGTGTLEDLELGAWTGYALDQALDPDRDSGRVATQLAERVVVRGRVLVTVTSSLTAGERADDAATTLASTVIDDYLARLA